MDAIELLTQDHREVEGLFAQLATEGADRRQVLEQISKQLAMHDGVEKRIFYPEVEQSVPGGQALAERALRQHEETEQLLASVDGRDPSDPEVARRLDLLIDAVRRHVKEEESEIFPALLRASERGQLARLGAKLESAKAWVPTHPHPRAPGSGPLAAPLNAAASVLDMARDSMDSSRATPAVESLKGEEKPPLADTAAGDKPPTDLMSWPAVYRDEQTQEALSSSDESSSDESSSDESSSDGSSAGGEASEGSADGRSASVAEASVAEASVADLVRQLAEQASRLARQEVALARLEVRDTGRRAGLGLAGLSLAGAAGLYGGGALVAGVIGLVAIPLGGWVAALVVGGGLAALAGMVGLGAGWQVRRAVRAQSTSPLDRVRTDLTVVKEGAAAASRRS